MSEQLPTTKICEFIECGQVFSQGHRTKYRWERMRYCSQDCGRRATAASLVRWPVVVAPADDEPRPIWRPAGWSETPNVRGSR